MNLPHRPVCRVALAALFALLPLLVLACSDGDNTFQGSTPEPASTPSPSSPAANTPAATEGSEPTAPPASATSAPGETPSATPAAPEAPTSGLPEVSVERFLPDITFERPTGAYQDAAGNWYVTEQPGRIQRVDAQSGEAALWMDITDRVDDSGNEMGLLGFALAPDFDTSHAFYVDYTGGGRSVVARYTASAGHASADPASGQLLLAVDQPYPNHNGGQIAFGPDGYLYVSLGDGGSGNDPDGNGQNLGTLLGAILRIDVSSGGSDYAVPPDNPFVDQPDARAEIWAYGFRNPWRFSFDRDTGDLWAGDVGQSSREEVDLVVKGGNYGWNVMEGFECRGGGTDCDTSGLLPPVFDYARGSGGTCSVTGGFVYRGEAISGLRGAYVFSDYCNGVIYALRTQDGRLTEQAQIAATGLNVSAFAEDNAGELYVLDLNGGIYKLVP